MVIILYLRMKWNEYYLLFKMEYFKQIYGIGDMVSGVYDFGR